MQPRIHIIALGVSDVSRSLRFYRDGLGFPTNVKGDDASVVFFNTGGVILELYPKTLLAKDINPESPPTGNGFSGISLAHNVTSKVEVETTLKLAEQAGGKIIKPAQDVFWGGYHGYFADPDNYYWEVAYWDKWQFHSDGALDISVLD